MHSPASFVSLADEQTYGQTHVRVVEAYSCGDRYDGTVAMDASGKKVKQGFGRYQFQNGSYYEGDWDNGTMHGKGRFVEAATGDRFEGTWSRGRRVSGVYFFANGDLYVGGFDHDTGHLKHGRCVVVEEMVPYDAVYHNDKMVQRRAFDAAANALHNVHTLAASGETRHASRSTSAQRPAETVVTRNPNRPQNDYEAAKIILRSRREELEGDSEAKRFGSIQRGQIERFGSIHIKNADVKDAFRYHHR